MKSASKIISRIGIGLLLSVGLFNLAGCGEDFNLSLSQYKIENLKHKGTYVGLPNEEVSSSKPKLPAEIKISYSSNSGRLPVFLNGQTVSQHLTYSNTEASLETAKIADLLRQGVNTLSVAPLSFGPQATFSFDNAGPFIDVNQLKDVSGGYELELRVADTTSITELYVQAVDYQWDGGVDDSQYKEFKTSTQTPVGEKTFFTQQGKSTIWRTNSAIDADASMYLIYAKDAYGYETTNYYLAPDQKINNIFKLALDKEVTDNLVPMAKSMMENMHVYAPIEMQFRGQEPKSEAAVAADALDKMSAWETSSGVYYGSDYSLVPAEETYNAAAWWYEAANENYCGYADIDIPVNLRREDFKCTAIKKEGTGITNLKHYCSLDDLEYIPNPGKIKPGLCSRISLTEAKIGDVDNLAFTLSEEGRGRLHLETKVNDLDIRMGIRNIQCGFKAEVFRSRYTFPDWYRDWGVEVDQNTGIPTGDLIYDGGAAKGDFCRDIGEPAALGLVKLGDMNITASYSDVNGDVTVNIHDGDLSLKVEEGLSLGLSKDLKVGSSSVDWIIGALSGLLNDMFVGIVEGTLQQNMKDFTLGFDLFADWDEANDPSLRMQAQGYQVWTNADNNPATPLKWYMYYAGFLQSLKEHPELDNKVLGSFYAVEPVLHPVTTDSKLDLAVNINMVNQALMSLYRSGMSHITVTNRKFDDAKGNGTNVHFGPGITNTFAMKNNDIRVQLVPRGPGVLEMKQGGNGVQGTLYYRNAKMLVETYSKGSWTRNFTMEVDMKIGVLMTAEDQKFQIKILGMPELDINKIALGKSDDYIYNNESESVNIFLNNNAVRGVVQFAVDLVLNLAVPQMAMKIGEIDYPGIAVPKTDENGDYIVDKGIWMTTESIEANNGAHLSFGIGMDFDKECTVKEGIQLDETGKPELTFCDAD